ncbi:hypothetical protein [Anaerosporobacter sp.]
MKKLGKNIITHLFLYIGIICFSFVSFNIARNYILRYNAIPVQCEITKVVDSKEDLLDANQDSSGRHYEYGTYVDYSLEGVDYNNILIKEEFGQVGKTVELYSNKYVPKRLFYLGGTKILLLKIVALEGILCILIEIYLNYRRKKRRLGGTS